MERGLVLFTCDLRVHDNADAERRRRASASR